MVLIISRWVLVRESEKTTKFTSWQVLKNEQNLRNKFVTVPEKRMSSGKQYEKDTICHIGGKKL